MPDPKKIGLDPTAEGWISAMCSVAGPGWEQQIKGELSPRKTQSKNGRVPIIGVDDDLFVNGEKTARANTLGGDGIPEQPENIAEAILRQQTVSRFIRQGVDYEVFCAMFGPNPEEDFTEIYRYSTTNNNKGQ